MTTFEVLNLRENPFKSITPDPNNFNIENSLWAGLDDVKEKLVEIYESFGSDDAMRITLNWGPWGGGKTYAAYYFVYNPKFNEQNYTQIYVRSPKDGSSSVNQLYRSIIDYMSFSRIKLQVNTLLEKIGDKALFDLINQKINSEEYSKAIILVGSKDTDIESIMHRYLYSNVTNTELKKVGLARTIDTEIDKIKVLSGLFHCFIGNETETTGKLVLWIDELEDLIYYSAKHYKIFSQALRDLADTMNENFGLFLNFTLAEPEQDTIELILGSALWSRITNKIRFSDLDFENAKKYVKDLINFYQIEKKDNFEPFSEETIELLIKIVETIELTPREINKVFNNIFTYSQKNGYEIINKPVYDEWYEKFEREE